MKILVIESSPHQNGSSNLLAEAFMRGAKEAGHTVTIFNAATANIRPCLACNACGMNGVCIQKDSMEDLKELIRQNEMLVFVTPLYYFGFSAQLKAVIDRFHSFNSELIATRKKSFLIVTAHNHNPGIMNCIKAHYLTITDFLGFDNLGWLLATGCGTPQETAQSPYPEKAFLFGRSLQ